jgi:hypothetical protein
VTSFDELRLVLIRLYNLRRRAQALLQVWKDLDRVLTQQPGSGSPINHVLTWIGDSQANAVQLDRIDRLLTDWEQAAVDCDWPLVIEEPVKNLDGDNVPF